MRIDRVLRVAVLGGHTHGILFKGDGPIVPLDHDKAEARRALVLHEFGDQVCPCLQMYGRALKTVKGGSTTWSGPIERFAYDNDREGVKVESLYPAYMRRFRSKEALHDYRLVRTWRKAWNRLHKGKRVEDWYHKSMGPKLGLRFLDFPMAVLKELRQRGHNATKADTWSNRIVMDLHDRPAVLGQWWGRVEVQFYSQGTSVKEESQFWRLCVDGAGAGGDRYCRFREDRRGGDQDIRHAADLVEGLWVLAVERGRARLGSGRTQASRRLAMLEDMFGTTTPGLTDGQQAQGDPRPVEVAQTEGA